MPSEPFSLVPCMMCGENEIAEAHTLAMCGGHTYRPRRKPTTLQDPVVVRAIAHDRLDPRCEAAKRWLNAYDQGEAERLDLAEDELFRVQYANLPLLLKVHGERTMNNESRVQPGQHYRHHKGPIYLVLHLATNSTNTHVQAGRHLVDGRTYESMDMWQESFADCYHLHEGEPMVVYLSSRLTIHVRALAEFVEEVRWPDGQMRPRFVRCDPDENKE